MDIIFSKAGSLVLLGIILRLASPELGFGQTAASSDSALEARLRMIVREELARALGSGQHSATTITVDSHRATWMKSSYHVKAGQHVLVEANAADGWTIGWGRTNAAGHDQPHEDESVVGLPTFHRGIGGQDWHWASVVAAVGNNLREVADPDNEVEIGMSRSFTVDKDGDLYFICNDNTAPPKGGNGYDDNAGVIRLSVTVTDPSPTIGGKSAQSAPTASPMAASTGTTAR